MVGRGLFITVALAMLLTSTSNDVQAQAYDPLVECTALSTDPDDIHACMDNYLDLMDDGMNRITVFLAESLSGESLDRLEASQLAFEEYRRQNCLWYLNFSSPREAAEQIAKNCLAHMSQQRLSELQSLVTAEDTTGQVLRGFYFYGAEHNSFQPCGSDNRYWLEGESTLVSQAQQQYLAIATSDLQVLYGTFAGAVDEEAQAPQGHQGVFILDAIIDLRLPVESDCRLPGDAATTADSAESASFPVVADSDLSVDTIPDTPDSPELPEEQLTAYFGAWQVDCTNARGDRGCELTVKLVAPAQAPPATLSLIRQKAPTSTLEVRFADREIDSPSRILWRVDDTVLGDIVGSEIRVDQSGTRQLVPSTVFIYEEMLPMMIRGTNLYLDVLASVDEATGERYAGTLIGLTKALRFADGFIRDGGS